MVPENVAPILSSPIKIPFCMEQAWIHSMLERDPQTGKKQVIHVFAPINCRSTKALVRSTRWNWMKIAGIGIETLNLPQVIQLPQQKATVPFIASSRLSHRKSSQGELCTEVSTRASEMTPFNRDGLENFWIKYSFSSFWIEISAFSKEAVNYITLHTWKTITF